MPSTYTTNGGIELPANGDQASTWGDTVNINMEIIDRLTNGVGSISLSGTTHTLSTTDGTLGDGQYSVLVLGGSPSDTNLITVAPSSSQHVYIVKNASGQTATFTQGSGANVSVLTGTTKIIYCDGAGSSAAVSDITGTLDLGALIVNGITITSSPAELNVLTGMSATTAQLNILDGVTATTAQLNILDGVTATTAQLNYLDITTLGISEASKALTANDSDGVAIGGSLIVGEGAGVLGFFGVDGSFGLTGPQTGNITAVAALDIDCSAGSYFTKTISTDSTFTFSNAPAGSYGFTLELTQTSGAVTWPTAVKWPNNAAPSLTAGTTHLFIFVTDDSGTRWRGAALVDYVN